MAGIRPADRSMPGERFCAAALDAIYAETGGIGLPLLGVSSEDALARQAPMIGVPARG